MPDKKEKTLIQEAIEDTNALKDAALEAAKNQVIDMLLPDLKKLVNQRLIKENKQTKERPSLKEGNNVTGENNSMDYDMKEIDELASFFPQVEDEMGGGCAPTEENGGASPVSAGGSVPGIPSLGESEDSDSDDEPVMEASEDEEEPMDEEVEISNEALEQIYSEALQTEVSVKKGFSDFTKGGDFGKEKPDSAGGIADLKSGEHQWSEETPPAAKDWQIKEGKKLQAMIVKGFNENKALREANGKLTEQRNKLFKLCKESIGKLNEQNLFNAKVLHVNKLLNSHPRLTTEQKKRFMDRIDKATTVESVKSTYETISETLQLGSQVVTESKSAKVSVGSRPMQSGAPNRKTLNESVAKQHAGQPSGDWSRVLQLAGIKTGK